MRTPALLSFFLFSALAIASPLPDYPFVYANGTATRGVAPDKASITFSIKTYDPQADKAFTQQSEVAAKVLDFASKLGLSNDAIVAKAIEKRAVRKQDDHGNDLEILGYETTRSVTADVSELGLFPKLIEFLYSQPNVESITATFGRKDEATIRQALVEDACHDARERAERMAKGFGKKLGAIRAISEFGVANVRNFLTGGESYSAMYADLQSPGQNRIVRDFRVIPATVTFNAGIYALFTIE
jgi:uncharacterized protein